MASCLRSIRDAVLKVWSISEWVWPTWRKPTSITSNTPHRQRDSNYEIIYMFLFSREQLSSCINSLWDTWKVFPISLIARLIASTMWIYLVACSSVMVYRRSVLTCSSAVLWLYLRWSHERADPSLALAKKVWVGRRHPVKVKSILLDYIQPARVSLGILALLWPQNVFRNHAEL